MRLGIEHGPTLGQMMRAARMGFFWSAVHGCFIRIRRDGEANFSIDLQPCGLIPNERKDCQRHFIWWEDDNTIEAVEAMPALKGLIRLKLPINIRVNDEGKCIRQCRDEG